MLLFVRLVGRLFVCSVGCWFVCLFISFCAWVFFFFYLLLSFLFIVLLFSFLVALFIFIIPPPLLLFFSSSLLLLSVERVFPSLCRASQAAPSRSTSTPSARGAGTKRRASAATWDVSVTCHVVVVMLLLCDMSCCCSVVDMFWGSGVVVFWCFECDWSPKSQHQSNATLTQRNATRSNVSQSNTKQRNATQRNATQCITKQCKDAMQRRKIASSARHQSTAHHKRSTNNKPTTATN